MARAKSGFTIFHEVAEAVMLLQGAIACAIVDLESGTCLASAGNNNDAYLESAGLVNARLLRTKMQMVQDQHHEAIEDVLITLGHQYHLIHLIRCDSQNAFIFAYLVLDRATANIVMSRRKLAEIKCALIADSATSRRTEEARFAVLRVPSGVEKVDDFGQAWTDDELPPFMRDDVALKLLGINEEGEYLS